MNWTLFFEWLVAGVLALGFVAMAFITVFILIAAHAED